MAEQEEKTAFIKLSAETLKQYALLEISNSCSTRRGKEAHPKAVLSTKPPQPEDATSPCDTTPVATCKRVLSSRVVSAPNCTAMKPKRQFSTSVDPVSTSGEKHPAEGFVVLGTQGQGERNLLRSRPKDLELKRNLSSHSSSGSTPGNPCSPAMMCSPSASEDTELGLVHSYPGPAPMPLWRHHQEPACKKENQHLPFHCQPLPIGANPQTVLARRIAERLKAIGDQVNENSENFEIQDLIEDYVTSMSLGLGSGLSWSSVVQLYRTLSRLLAQCLDNGTAVPEENEPWMSFTKLWKIVLQSVVGWIMDNGGWTAFIRETEYSFTSYITSSTPDFHRRRRCTYSHSPSEATPFQFSTPQTHRRPLGTFQRSPTISCGGVQERMGISCGCGQERRSRVLSLTEEGLFHLDKEGEGEEEEEEDGQRSNDEGLHMRTPSSLSIFSPDNSPIVKDPPNKIFRPHSTSTHHLTPGASGGEGRDEEGSHFDRSRSHSFPCRKRPDSADKAVSHSTEIISEGDSLDSGLEASSELSIASIDSMQYSTLGVSALCILEAVKSCLDHQ